MGFSTIFQHRVYALGDDRHIASRDTTAAVCFVKDEKQTMLFAKRIEEIVLPESDTRIVLDRHSNALHLIQRLRDEAHRFAITHLRALRSKASVASRLDTVAGVGENRRRAILKHFKTVEALKAATADEIAQVPGLPESVAYNVYAMLHEGENESED